MFFLIQSLVLLLLFSIQTTWLDALSVAGVRPDLALIFVVYCGFQFRGNHGVGMGAAVGLIQDCLSGGLLGVNTLSKSLVALFFSTLKDKILVEGFLPTAFFIFSASLFDGLVYHLVLVTLFKGDFPGGWVVSSVFAYALYNACIGPILFYGLDLLKKWMVPRHPTLYLGAP